MQQLVDFIVSLNIPLVDEGVARLISHLIFASIIAVVAPASLIILTWLERKIIARIQRRIGPNRAGPFGLLQGIADMVKMFTKEDITPANAERWSYNIAPGLSVFSSIMAFAVIPFVPGFIGADLNVGVLYLFAVGGLGVLAILMGGWSSNNKYALLGAFRVVAMLLTYEVPMVLALIMVTMTAGSMSLQEIVMAQAGINWYIFSMPVVFLIFFISGVAETGRSPFDLIEAESEIIAGFHTEYSGIKFGMFMIGEYVHMFALAFFSAVLFLGGWSFPGISLLPLWLQPILGFIVLNIKMALFVFIMMWFRGTLPRFRIDHLQDFAWKFLVPLSVALLIVMAIAINLVSQFIPAGAGRTITEFVVILVVNLGITGIALFFVTRAAQQSRSKALRSVTAVEGAPASK
ncbi:MAG: NADH-quinone oxidoreductase subunit NuoH [Anaerolineae bacterium]|nr:NADH-quinone oxidoreductase subunit NuoH [Anaerolineae bacterium]